MKKLFTLFTLLVVSFAMFGCNEKLPENPSGSIGSPDEKIIIEEVEQAPYVEEIVRAPSKVFGISVDSVANGATVTESPVVISGKVSAAAISVSINGYELQSYEAGSGAWSYIAKSEFQNLKVGENIYSVKAEGPDGISASTTLMVNFEPIE